MSRTALEPETRGRPDVHPASPYKGLVPFDDSETDAVLFFGRETEREIIAANLKAHSLTVLYGPSGVGKSSVLRAGVVHHLRREAESNIHRFGTPEFAAVYFADWPGDPRAGVAAAVADEVRRLTGEPFEPSSGAQLADVLAESAEQLDGTLYVVLDQMEEYFLYHGHGTGEGSFTRDLAGALAAADLPVAFVISVREDALASLDVCKRLIPNLFGNLLRLERLDYRSARAAITGPLASYNGIVDASTPFTIDDDCVDAVLAQVASGRVVLGERGRGTAVRDETPLAEQRFETPYLQLVMQRLWDEEQRAGGHTIRRSTLDRLGGADRIVRTHLDSAMNDLRRKDRAVAASAFRYLVTPSNTKIAYTIPDLAEYAEVRRERLAPVVERLATPQLRILRTVTGAGEKTAYEIFHDTLAPAVLDWRARYFRRRRVRRLQAVTVVVALILLAALVTVAVTKLSESSAPLSVQGAAANAFVTEQRAKIARAARWGVMHEKEIHYSQGATRFAWLRAAPFTLPMAVDTSSFVAFCYWAAGAPNPNGGAYSLEKGGYTGTMLVHMKHIPRGLVKVGDVVIWTPPATGQHSAIVVETGPDPLLVSHGSESDPRLIRFSKENRGLSANGHDKTVWLTVF